MFDILTHVRAFGEPRPARKSPPTPIEVVPLVPDRVRACALIDRMSLDGPWDEGRFHRTRAEFGRFGLVALHGPHRRVVGYAICAVDGGESTVRVLRFATEENVRRRGVMRQLFARVADDAACDGQRRIEVPIPETLVDPRRFLQAIGFRGKAKGGVLRDYYAAEDAYVFSRPTGVCCGK